jgi:hypothetical protein
MTIIYSAADEKEREFPEAHEWEAGVAVKAGSNQVGFGFFLWDEHGKPLGSCCMTPEQAMKQGIYLVENAMRMMAAQMGLSMAESISAANMKRVNELLERCGARPADG